MEEYILYIIRGVPGSGKSDLGEKLAPDAHFEANDFFTDKKDEYHYNPALLSKAHNKCKKNVENAMMDGVPYVAVCNTFVCKWEYEQYIDIAEKLGYKPVEIICRGNFVNKHNVPSEKIANMLKNFEY